MTTSTFVNRVCIATSASGVGSFALGNAVSAFRGVEALVDGKTYSYCAQQDSNFEFGRGTYHSGSRTLTRGVILSSYGAAAPVAFNVGAQITFPLLAEDIAEIISNVSPIPSDAYSLQWIVEFEKTPTSSEILGIYSIPTPFEYLPNFSGSAVSAPLANPTADFVMGIQQQTAGIGAWENIGSISVAAMDGSVLLSTVSGAPVILAAGDRVRVVAPSVVDASISNFSITFKGYANYSGPPTPGGFDASLWSALANSSVPADGAGLIGANDGAGGSLWTTVRGFIAYLKTNVGSRVLGYLSPIGSTTVSGALDIIYPGARSLWAQVEDKLQRGQTTSGSAEGTSLTYGQDTSVNGQTTTLPFNGSNVPRSWTPWPETLQGAMALNQYTVAMTVVNRGFPGDTAEQIFNRWAGADFTDWSALECGTNDGKTLAVPMSDFKFWVSSWIERKLRAGIAPMLIAPPPIKDVVTEARVSLYRGALRELALEYDCPFIDASEQLTGLQYIWQGIDVPSGLEDLVHLNSFAYAEWGFHISARFNIRDFYTGRQITPNSIWYPQDLIGYGGALVNNTAARATAFLQLVTNQRYFISAYFPEDVLPVIHSYNSGGTPTDILLQYAGNGTHQGLIASELVHDSTLGVRQILTGPILRRGWRTLVILNNGSPNVEIDVLEFRALDNGPSLPIEQIRGNIGPTYFTRRTLAALGGAGHFAVAVDYARSLKFPYSYSAELEITDNGGLVVESNPQGQTSLSDMLFLRRVGNDLILRDLNGGTPTDTTASGVFTTGLWKGDMEIVNDGATVTAYIDGALKITYTPSTLLNVRGFPGVITDAGQTTFFCHATQVTGVVKGPY